MAGACALDPQGGALHSVGVDKPALAEATDRPQPSPLIRRRAGTHFAAFRASHRLKRRPGGKSKPRLRVEVIFPAVIEAAFEHQHLGPTRRVEWDRGAGRPAFDANVLATVAK